MGRGKVTPQQCEEMRNRRENGERPADIARDYEFSTSTAREHIRERCNCGEDPFTHNKCEKIKELRENGRSYAEIVDLLNLELTESGTRYHATGRCSCDASVSGNVITEEACKDIQRRYEEEDIKFIQDDYDVCSRTIRYHANGECKC